MFTTLSGPPAPLVSTPIDGSRLSVNTPTYSGTATPGSSVTIFVDGSNVGQTTANAGGNWTFTSVNALTDASHAVYAQATLDGLDSPNSTTITFTIDTTSPIAPVVTAPLNGDILSDNTPTYAGTAEPSSTVTVLVDGSPTGTTTADASGNWSYTPGTPLSDGTHTVRARAMDNVGNTGPTSATTTFTIDTTHPTVTISSSAPNPTNTGPILLSMTFSELVTGFVAGDISVNNGTLSDFAGSGSLYTATLTPTAAGLVSVSVSANVAQDAAGNMNQASTVFTIQYLPNAILTGFAATATTVCVGSPVTFTATVENVTGSYNYTLTNGSASSLTGSTTNTAFSQTVTASGSGLQSFSLLVSDNGQLGSGMTSVTINSLPMATILTPASTTLTCSTTSISLTATGGGTYQWEDNSTNAIRSVTTPNTYTVTVTGSNGCTALATTSIFSNTVLSLEAGPSLPQANVGVVLSLTATGATTYQWSAPSTASLTTPATGSAVSASLTTAGLQTFTVVGTTGACSQSSLVSVTALPGPDLSATLSLPDANFPASSSKDLLVQVQEVNGSAATGNIVITLTVPTGYSVSFDNSLTSINVSGGSTNPVSVQNSKWQVSSRVAGRQLSLVINSGESVGAKGTLSLGFSITRTTATGGSVSNITINVADDSGGQYDVNRLNNVYARIINSL
ncbi:Ig-like domain-containing protein [Spirosoma telluris]|uniref:Ig-like domain-containing protein n=1 Tax=Spirosoma telluris TaxID=2183553 RepID=UPI0018DE2493